MNINFEVDVTPEEMRRFMGLPDMQAWHQQMLDKFTEQLQSSQEQQEAFFRSMFNNPFAPQLPEWQSFFAAANADDDTK